MLDAVVEFILEALLGGAMEAAGSKSVPAAVRILSAGLVLLFLLGVFGWLLWTGLRAGSPARILIAIAFLGGTAALAFYRVRRFKNQNG